MIVALDFNVYVFSLIDDLNCLYSTPTLMNPKGVLAVNPNEVRTILCCPAQMNNEKCLGYVQIVDLGNLQKDNGLKIRAHENSLNIIELNNDGTILATSSERVNSK